MAPGPLADRTVIVARPAGQGRALVRRLAGLGADAFNLPTARIAGAADDRAVAALLDAAGRADALVFTSPNAVRHALALRPGLRPGPETRVIAVGPGTARALRRGGLAAELPAGRWDSEGVLALPVLAAPRGREVLVIGAPGGRGAIESTLRARGARVRLVAVYRRAAPRWDRRHRERLAHLPRRAWLLLSSAEAAQVLRDNTPAALRTRWRGVRVIAASARVAAAAQAAGFAVAAIAASARAADLIAALHAATTPRRGAFR